jgi:hypothetical protein
MYWGVTTALARRRGSRSSHSACSQRLTAVAEIAGEVRVGERLEMGSAEPRHVNRDRQPARRRDLVERPVVPIPKPLSRQARQHHLHHPWMRRRSLSLPGRSDAVLDRHRDRAVETIVALHPLGLHPLVDGSGDGAGHLALAGCAQHADDRVKDRSTDVVSIEQLLLHHREIRSARLSVDHAVAPEDVLLRARTDLLPGPCPRRACLLE